ncbi:histidinol-phosphate transaminase [Paracoccus caeni]|uniref:Histidinol-phosphate aminotransferase n=1 Tax=Paracoccus caeni TaxID=657651 RepID=A0A934SHI2_9RHOB|nr:histidinol-phosphate transaminase [Paracoccus caeni]MBK4215299.1 histidinol-phosphate transaminase [Paracoccus caeni]
MTQITPKPGIMDIKLYVSGESKLAGRDQVLKLSSNENPSGSSPATRAAFAEAATDLHRYPSTDHASLRRAIGEVHGLDPERIICGVGSDEVLQFVVQAFAGVGDEVITTEHGFSMYPILARMYGATPVTVPERERRIDVDAVLAAVTPRTKIVFIANPGNPTGTMLTADELEKLASGLPGHVLLVHDGAYTEFAGDFDGGVSLVDRFPNVVMTRTFSKIYGLGGLRIGWGYAQRPLIEVLTRLRQPFNLSNAQLAAAEAAVRDQDFVDMCAALNEQMRDWLHQVLNQMGIGCDVSYANFVLARFANPDEAEAADAALRDAGILVRRVGGYGLPAALRITVGDEEGTSRVVEALRRFMTSRRAAE